MPMVGKTKYPYTKSGMEAAKKAAAKKGVAVAKKTWKGMEKKK